MFNFVVKEVQRIRLLLQNYSQTTQGHQLGQQDVVSHPKDRRLYLERYADIQSIQEQKLLSWEPFQLYCFPPRVNCQKLLSTI